MLRSLSIPIALVAALAACADSQRRSPPEATTTPRALTSEDADCDGIPDEIEAQIGLDPKDPRDGDDDADGDGVPTAVEVRLGGDPSSPDSDGDGTDDG